MGNIFAIGEVVFEICEYIYDSEETRRNPDLIRGYPMLDDNMNERSN